MAEKRNSFKHYKEMNEELKKLVTDGRAEIAQRLKVARSQGNLCNNPEYHGARKQWMLLEERIAYLQTEIEGMEIIVDDLPNEN